MPLCDDGPRVGAKTEELFLRWMSLPHVRCAVDALVRAVKAGEPLPSLASPAFLRRPESPPVNPASPQKRGDPGSPLLGANLPSGLAVSPGINAVPSPRASISLPPRAAVPRPSLQRGLSLLEIPPFFTPKITGLTESQRSAVQEALQSARAQQRISFFEVAQACGLPKYCGPSIFRHVEKRVKGKGAEADRTPLSRQHGSGSNNASHDVAPSSSPPFFPVERDVTSFLEEVVLRGSRDLAEQFVRVIAGDAECRDLEPAHLRPLVFDIVYFHPGLSFLHSSPEFHERYVDTVVARIFYTVDLTWSGKISVSDLRRSNLLDVIEVLETEMDINKVVDYFSYEHFYVIYTSFWKLDTDHDLIISRKELSQYGDCGLNEIVLDRIFSRAVQMYPRSDGKLTFWDFVWFILSEEDKTTAAAVKYWFRILDLNGDGMISMFEIEIFYNEQLARLEDLASESLSFEDMLCQLLDIVRPKSMQYITLSDLKLCKQSSLFINSLTNANKFLDFEERDHFKQKDEHGRTMSDWERFAAEEYDILASEEDAEGFG